MNSYDYDSFGKLSDSTGTLTNQFQDTGREFDEESGIYQYRARYYDASVGQFLSEDPIGLLGGSTDFYAYVRNSPNVATDPSGLQTVVVVFWNNPEHTGFPGEHAAVYVTNDGHPILYDPSGDSRINGTRPGNDIFENEEADMNQYLRVHGTNNIDTNAEIFVFDTTNEQEKEIASRINRIGRPGTARCASTVSKVLKGIGPFKDLTWTPFPSALAEQLRILEQPEILRRAINRMVPKAPEVFPRNWIP